MDSNDDPKDGPVVAATAFGAVGVYGVGALFFYLSVVWLGVVSLAGACRRVARLPGELGDGWRCTENMGRRGSGLGVQKANRLCSSSLSSVAFRHGCTRASRGVEPSLYRYRRYGNPQTSEPRPTYRLIEQPISEVVDRRYGMGWCRTNANGGRLAKSDTEEEIRG